MLGLNIGTNQGVHQIEACSIPNRCERPEEANPLKKGLGSKEYSQERG